MPVNEHWCWFGGIIARRLIDMDLDMPPFISRRDRDIFEDNALMNLQLLRSKPLRGCRD